MKFLISMSDVEDEWDTLPQEEQERIGERHTEFQRELGGRHVCCYGMRPSAEAKTVRLHADGRVYQRQRCWRRGWRWCGFWCGNFKAGAGGDAAGGQPQNLHAQIQVWNQDRSGQAAILGGGGRGAGQD